MKKENKKEGNKKILIVEDDPFLVDIYETKLTQSGFDIDLASNGEDCLRKLKEKDYDLMLLDIVLPKIDGWEVLEKIKEMKEKGDQKNLYDMKIMILSNLGQKEEIQKGLRLGATGFLIKAHYTPSHVVEEIKKTLNL